MKHVVVTNQPSNQVFRLMKNAINLGERFPSVQIGIGKGFGYKIILLRMFLDECDEDEVVLFTDAHDVYVTGSHDEILARYWSMNADIVFSAEKNCWPVKHLETQYTTHTDKYIKYKYLNSGALIGKVSVLKQWMDQNFHNVSGSTDDQLWYTQLYLKDQKRVKLDTRCEIFQCLHLALYDIDQHARTNQFTGTAPLIWHSNGSLLEFFMTNLCSLPWTPPTCIEIDQQIISPENNIVCVTDRTDISVVFSSTVKTLQEVADGMWIFIPGTTILPEYFEYRIYGKVVDTRKVYILVNSDGTLSDSFLYFDRSKTSIDEFMRAGMVDAL